MTFGQMTKFNKIIMNPPYDKNLHLKILREAMKHVEKEGGEIINLSPIRWLQDPLAEYKRGSDWKIFSEIRENITNLDVILSEDSDRLFGISWSDLGIYYFNNKSSKKYDVSSLVDYCPQFIIDLVMNLKDRFIDHASKTEHFGSFIRVPTVYNPSGGNPDYLLFTKDISKCLNIVNDKHNVCYFSFETEEEARNFFNVAHLKLYRFIKKCLDRSNVSFKHFPFLPSYKKPWTDEDLYEYFNLNEEEIKEIENAIQ